ncbi:rbm-39 [Pristionchus pacificus]|uniref:RNA binding protein n=1 Tax=Pristionchus pacificus TaxID=54126 RepID=A0A2A6BYD3_PRIPA|nr:rbm-39 [Pristionchus pacificus]|eukprot:PDM70827.1 RNA binding protein [Pristionchus pacificus]
MTTEPDGMENGDPREQSVESKKGEKSSRDVRRDDEKRRKSRSRSPREKKSRKRSSSRDRKRSRSRDRSDRKRSRSRDRGERRRSRSRDRRDRDRGERVGDRDRDRRRSRSPARGGDRDRRRSSRSPRRDRSRERRRSRSPPRRGSPSGFRSAARGGGRLPGPERRDVMPFTARKSPPRDANLNMTAEERDQRTLFILQIARQTRPRDLEEFFSSVGNVRDVRIITDSRTGRSKGIAYVEFWEEESVPLGLALNGQKLLNAPLIIQRTCAERNRAANAIPASVIGLGPAGDKTKPVKLSVTSLHPDIDEDMLAGILDPFGRLEKVEMAKDSAGKSTGTAVATFRHAEDAQKAMEQLNGFDLAGRAIRVTFLDEDDARTAMRGPNMETIAEDKTGISLGQGGRIQLMAKLAASGGVNMPTAPTAAAPAEEIPAIATACFMLSNMFDPSKENEAGWADDVREDVIEECHKNGGALHVYVDQASAQGNVYVKCPTVSVAYKSVNSLHGRWFSGKVITANYVPAPSYHDLFPDARHATVPLVPGAGRMAMAPPPPGPIPPPPPPAAGYGYGYGY